MLKIKYCKFNLRIQKHNRYDNWQLSNLFKIIIIL